MIIGFDLDNTLIEYDDAFHLEAIKRGYGGKGVVHKKKEIRNYFNSIGKPEIFTEIQAEVYGICIKRINICPILNMILHELKKNKHKIYVVSHKTKYPYKGPKYDLRLEATNWIEKEISYKGDRSIQKDNIYFESTKKDKVNRIKALGIEVYIDDLVEILNDLDKCIAGILYSPNGYVENWPKEKTLTSWNDNDFSRMIENR